MPCAPNPQSVSTCALSPRRSHSSVSPHSPKMNMKNSFTPRSFRTVAVCTVALTMALAASVARADHSYTNNATGDYNVATYWNPNGVPGDNTHNNNGSNN